MFTDMNVKVRQTVKSNTGYGATKGENQKDLPSRIGADQAVRIQNYFVTGDGRLVSREGITEKESFTGTPSMIEQFTDDILAYAYDDGSNSILATYTLSTGVSAIKKTFTSRGDVGGVRYGDFFFASDKTDKIGCIYKSGQFLNYDGQTANFTVGETVTGAGGATGVVEYDVDTGAGGTLVLSSVTGVFVNNEAITGSVSGIAVVSGVLFDWYELSNSTPARHLAIYSTYKGSSLVAGQTDVNDSQIKWSHLDTGDDILTIPFIEWSEASPPNPTDGGTVLYQVGGTLNAMISHDDKLFAFYDDATCVFHMETLDIDAFGLSRTVIVDQQGKNFGGNSAISTPKGVFFANERGVHYFTLSASDDVSVEVSSILGEDKIQELVFTDSAFVWDGKSRIYIFCGNDSTANNFTLVYDIELGVWTEITGWNMRRGARVFGSNKNDLYGVGSISGSLYKLFDGYNDDGLTISGRITFRQENGGDATMLKDMENIWLQGTLSPSTLLKVDINKWDRRNTATEGAKTFWWAGTDASVEPFGFGVTSFGKPINPGDVLIGEDFVHKGRTPLRNFLKYQIEISSSYGTPHELHMITTEILSKYRVKLENLSTSRPS